LHGKSMDITQSYRARRRAGPAAWDFADVS